MLQRYIRALADLSVNVKTYQHGISGAVARDTPVPSDCAKKCQQAFLAPLPGTACEQRYCADINLDLVLRI